MKAQKRVYIIMQNIRGIERTDLLQSQSNPYVSSRQKWREFDQVFLICLEDRYVTVIKIFL